MLQQNKTFEVYAYEDPSAQTEINFQDEIILNQSDINDIQIFYRQGIILIEGFVRHGDKRNSDNILKLNKWARVSGECKNWLKKTNIKIAKNGFVVRELLLNTFIVDYYECFKKGQHRFYIILRSYKYARLDGIRGETGANETESYVKSSTIKKVQTTMIITPVEPEPIKLSEVASKAVLSSSNVVTAIGMGKMLLSTSNPVTLSFFLIAHGTGFISEFVADVYFTVTGDSHKLGSFNMTRDWVYKPLFELLKKQIEKENSNIKLSDTLGEDVYNMGNLAFSLAELGKIGLKHAVNFTNNFGLGYLYNVTLKQVQVSRYGRVLQPVKYIGLTPVKATLQLISDMGLDTYGVGKTIEGEIKKKNE